MLNRAVPGVKAFVDPKRRTQVFDVKQSVFALRHVCKPLYFNYAM
jgi:hypothetical protein